MIEVRAELVASVWQLVANVGDQVERGDLLAILESMKMEIHVIAPASGRVHEVLVEEGQRVNGGDVVVVLAVAGIAKPS